MINVLVFPCGSEIAFELYNCLSCQKDITLFGGTSIDDGGRFYFSNYINNIPFIDDDKFIEVVKNIVKQYKIDFIYPTMDLAITKLKTCEDQLGCKVLSSPKETVSILQRKSLTYEYFKNIIRVPRILTELEFPCFSKPDIGSSSRNTLLIDCEISYNYAKEKFPKNLILEYLPGEEYTVDCFSNNQGVLKFFSARKRKKIVNGISVETELITDKKIDEIANSINNNLKLIGPWFFQLKKDKYGKYCLLEIASRFAGSSIINRLRGVNFAYLNILKEFGDVEILLNDYDIEINKSFQTKIKTNITYDTVYIDFDDTIIINNSVNLQAIRFIYNCLNLKKKIILITKHKNDIKYTLKKYRLDSSLFDEIIHINKDDDKFKYITSKNSIFIDDSFMERKLVKDKIKIPVFSVEGLEYL